MLLTKILALVNLRLMVACLGRARPLLPAALGSLLAAVALAVMMVVLVLVAHQLRHRSHLGALPDLVVRRLCASLAAMGVVDSLHLVHGFKFHRVTHSTRLAVLSRMVVLSRVAMARALLALTRLVLLILFGAQLLNL